MGTRAGLAGVTPLLFGARNLRSFSNLPSGLLSGQLIIDRLFSLVRCRPCASSEVQGSCRGMGMADSVTREAEIQKLWEQKQVLQKLQDRNTGNLCNGGDYQRFLPVSTVRSVRGYSLYPLAASGTISTTGNQGLGAQQVRTIMVEVKRNDLDRAIRRWRRKCKEENLRVLKDREYYIKPSEKRVLARKERDRRVAKKAFKQKLNWIMSRRQRGF